MTSLENLRKLNFKFKIKEKCQEAAVKVLTAIHFLLVVELLFLCPGLIFGNLEHIPDTSIPFSIPEYRYRYL